jgi:hypothetical protein
MMEVGCRADLGQRRDSIPMKWSGVWGLGREKQISPSLASRYFQEGRLGHSRAIGAIGTD